ncbi:hypothetical protein SODALDRAFT_68970 [Sodiomyces alkalinus F11]|uniref:Uncharacterized protein n=1 Tax=Sodiomyces alkalinus (strain CBS 110278 / VKM F-3762 / F11) TaxID=1314773 RepID=A0A3N2PM90_SODAK|nr:hypothetical protein SODALDRAFT_68970 [Sodiomyces alkalinus F11]ROT35524.1 hypothetical protein SODALDRAFT_68970 [Sodiomyces alkalinus F11]
MGFQWRTTQSSLFDAFLVLKISVFDSCPLLSFASPRWSPSNGLTIALPIWLSFFWGGVLTGHGGKNMGVGGGVVGRSPCIRITVAVLSLRTCSLLITKSYSQPEVRNISLASCILIISSRRILLRLSQGLASGSGPGENRDSNRSSHIPQRPALFLHRQKSMADFSVLGNRARAS